MTKSPNPGGLPYGSGSMQVRHSSWWLIYRDETGRIVQKNSGTTDPETARRILAERAIATLEARLAELRTVLHDRKNKGHGGEPRPAGKPGPKRGPAHTGVKANAGNRSKGTQKGSR